jgi:hypothetical protein
MSAASPKSKEQLAIIGKITNLAGILPGAVVTLAATRRMAVTTANGKFGFGVPARCGTVAGLGHLLRLRRRAN